MSLKAAESAPAGLSEVWYYRALVSAAICAPALHYLGIGPEVASYAYVALLLLIVLPYVSRVANLHAHDASGHDAHMHGTVITGMPKAWYVLLGLLSTTCAIVALLDADSRNAETLVAELLAGIVALSIMPYASTSPSGMWSSGLAYFVGCSLVFSWMRHEMFEPRAAYF